MSKKHQSFKDAIKSYLDRRAEPRDEAVEWTGCRLCER